MKGEPAMSIAELLSEGVVELSMKAPDKESAIRQLAEKLSTRSAVANPEAFLAAVFEREATQSTGIGYGVALPHARTDAVSSIVAAFGRFPEGVDFGAPDGKPATIVVLIGTPKAMLGTYLKLLARLTRLLKEARFRGTLLEAKTPEEVIAAFRNAETPTR